MRGEYFKNKRFLINLSDIKVYFLNIENIICKTFVLNYRHHLRDVIDKQALNLTLSPFWKSNPTKLLKYIHILLNYIYIMSQMISLGFCYNTFACGWKFLISWQGDLIEQNCSRMFAYRVDFMEWSHSKVAYYKCVFFIHKLETITRLKFKIDYESNIHTLKNFLKNVELIIIQVTIESLLYLTPYQYKGKFLYFLKHKVAQKVHIHCTLTFSSVP